MDKRYSTIRVCRTSRPGFSLAEVLVALGIFAIGFTAVASIFPVAILMQKSATEDVTTQIATDNALALIYTRKLENVNKTVDKLSLDTQVLPLDLKVHPLPGDDEELGQIADTWSRPDRSYPKSVTNVDERDTYWEPLVRRTKVPGTKAPDWQVFIFVMRQASGATYERPPGMAGNQWAIVSFYDKWVTGTPPFTSPGPKTRHPSVVRVDVEGVTGNRFLFNNRRWSETPTGEPDQVRTGDKILDSNGTIYQIIGADAGSVEVDGFILSSPERPDAIWYGVPPKAGKPNPVARILVLSDAVQ